LLVIGFWAFRNVVNQVRARRQMKSRNFQIVGGVAAAVAVVYITITVLVVYDIIWWGGR
jgi:uncharacterized membrane protein YidH (DUF202 family)